jgi:hypothetical protein
MVYVLSGLASDLTEVKQKETARAVFDLEQEAADNELARRLKVANAKLKHEERLAKIAAKPRQEERRDSGEMPGDWRQLTRRQKSDLAHSTRDEREESFPELAARTRREWHNRLDKIASKNGDYVV